MEGFDKAVDWGWFYFLTKPIFYMLHWFFLQFGNFGLAILALTVIFKLAFFPLANKSYKSMSRMKVLQPKMLELKERFGDDKQRLNQAMMDLYKKEKVNPASGCLPMLVQIPVFFALYKVLFVTIEMRQAPFYGWVHDLSAPDPLTILNGFGLIAWDVPDSLSIVNIGLWPIIMGLTMFLQQRLNPTPADPVQAKIFLFMPLIFTFILAPFPAGLVIYWAWNNLLSISQQYVIMKRSGADIYLFKSRDEKQKMKDEQKQKLDEARKSSMKKLEGGDALVDGEGDDTAADDNSAEKEKPAAKKPITKPKPKKKQKKK